MPPGSPILGQDPQHVRQAQYNAQLSAADLENERLTVQANLAVFSSSSEAGCPRQILDATVAATRSRSS